MFNAILFINLSVFNFLCRVHIRTTKIEPKKPLKKLTWKPINTKENYHVTHKYETIDHKKNCGIFNIFKYKWYSEQNSKGVACCCELRSALRFFETVANKMCPKLYSCGKYGFKKKRMKLWRWNIDIFPPPPSGTVPKLREKRRRTLHNFSNLIDDNHN